jgi:hypothetical protein
MSERRWWAPLLTLAAAAVSCRPSGPPLAIPAEMARCVPAGAVLLAGAKLNSLRASPIYPGLPSSAQSFLKPFQDANSLLLVFNGADILLIAQGHFREAAPGAILVGSNLMLSGSPVLLRAALAQRRSGDLASRDLLEQASPAAAGHALWITSRGNIHLPRAGDAENINRFLRQAQFATVGLRIEPPMQLDFSAQCATPDAATHLEETLRAFLSLSAAGVARQKELAIMLRSADVRREGVAVRAALTAPEDAMPQLFDFLAR